MAGGLFAVYRDTSAVPTSQSTSKRANGSSSNLSVNNRKKDGFPVFRDTARGVNGLQEKENLDPLGKGGKRSAMSGKGKKVCSDGTKPGETTKGKAVMGDRIVKKVNKVSTAASENGICTGTLKTRVLPPLPPLESDSPSPTIEPSPPSVPSVVDISLGATPAKPTLNSSQRSIDSPASNVDSGYGKVSDNDLELGEDGVEFDDESDMSIEVDTNELNRRARALTESPLAEITQAFTGLGRFSNSNAPASPSPLNLDRDPSSASLLRNKRSSPTKSVSALPPRLRPYYSTTATTKKIKPGQTAPLAPKSGPSSRSLRF
ncbi:uncharacterized protein JCM6883_000703 [Sporobolomyces salmoneus]|uniref:uncharacterized protein n=1 Tax=Sporobolomyces salmoneus TaxID=183962 RepID=UPI003170774A